jgi:LuxR family maltose regulon positive regulatory protein
MRPDELTGGPARRYDPPPAADGLVIPDGLCRRLTDPSIRVVTITAPGGYGKTSCVATWLAHEPRPSAWIDLYGRHNDPTLLLTDLLGALEEVTDIDRSDLPQVDGTVLQMSTELAITLERCLRRCSTPFVLVLDDAHLVSDHPAVDLIGALLSGAPKGSTIAVVGRASNLEVLHRLRVEADVLELSTTDLALTAPDVAELLARLGVDDASETDVRRLTDETEGWPVGVRLAALAAVAARRADNSRPLALSGREEHVAEYLDGQWLRDLDDDERAFITRASVLDVLTGPVCNAVLERVDSGEMLRRIRHDRLLVIPLDRRGDGYRMHGLLRDALLAALQRHDASEVQRLHRRASRWFAETGDADNAIRHAIAAADFDRAEVLITRSTAEYHSHGRYSTLAAWIDAMPRGRVEHSPGLCYTAASARLGMGDGAAVAVWVQLAEQALTASPDDTLVASLVALLRATTTTGPVTPALAAAARARDALPPGIWHAGALLVHGACGLMAGDDEAQHSLETGAHETSVLGAPSLEANCVALLSVIAAERGDDARANSLAIRAHDLLVAHGLDRAPALVVVTAAYAWAMARTGEPTAARTSWNRARSQLANWRDVFGWANVQARIALAHTGLLLGDRVGVEAMMREVHEYLVRQPDAVGAQRQVAGLEERLRHVRKSTGLGPSSLTTAELRVLHFLPTNLSLAEIATRLYVSRYTIKTHCESIYRKLGADSRSEAVERARALGLLGTSGTPAT